MAKPILLGLPPRDPRAELKARLEAAPAEHAEALLDAYEVLQSMHDRGVLDLARGALGSSDQVIEIAAEAANSPASIRGLRNLLLLVNMLGDLDPERLGAFTRAIPPALNAMTGEEEPPSLWRLAKAYLWDRDIRRGISALTGLLKALGAGTARPH